MAQIIHDVSFPNDGLGDPLRTAFVHQNEMNTELYETKVDKVTGQGLSENNYTDAEQTKLSGIEAGAEVNVQSDWLQGDVDADDYIKNKPENFVSFPYKAIFPFVDGNVFTMPDGVAVSDVRPNGSGSDIGWTQVGTTLTFTSYTLVADDFLVVIGFFNPANVFSPTSGSVQTITSADLAIGVDDSDPENIVLSFGGVVTDGATINGSGTSLDPLVVIGGGGGSTWGSITGTLSDQTDLQNALDLKQTKPIIISANKTAVVNEVYNNIANVIYTDPTSPSPVNGNIYTVNVLSGTATIGGVGYTSGIVQRSYNGTVWSSKNIKEKGLVWSNDIIVNLPVTGTTALTYVATVELPKNHLEGNGSIAFEIRADKSAVSGMVVLTAYLNTIDSATGEFILATNATLSTTTSRNPSIQRAVVFNPATIQHARVVTMANDMSSGTNAGHVTNALILKDNNFLRIYLQNDNTSVTGTILGITAKIYNNG